MMKISKGARQRQFVRIHLIPLLHEHARPYRIIDVGCGRGAIISEVQRATKAECYGIDNNRESLAMAAGTNSDVNWFYIDLESNQKKLQHLPGPFDVVLLCDVVEHIGMPALETAGRLVADDGIVYVRFPPWRSPFGGHQHLTRRWTRYVPWIHLFATGYSRSVGKRFFKRNPNDTESVHRTKAGSNILWKPEIGAWNVVRFQKYLLRPNSGYGVRAPGWMPDLFTMGVEAILKPIVKGCHG